VHSSSDTANYTITQSIEPGDFDALYAFLSASYWSRGIPRATMERSVRGSLSFVLRDASGNLAGSRASSPTAPRSAISAICSCCRSIAARACPGA